MDAVVKSLLEKETLDKKEVEAILEEVNRRLALGEDLSAPIKTNSDNDKGSTPPAATIVVKEAEEKSQAKKEREDGDSTTGGLTPAFG